MLGALAWQAATIIKMFFCLGGRSHGGYLVLAPGSPPCVLVCSLSAPFVRSDYMAQRSTFANRSWSYGRKTKGTIDNLHQLNRT